MSARKEYLRQIYKRYRFASRKDKTLILDEFCLNTGYQRKYATRILNEPLREAALRSGRSETYTNEHVYYLKKIWDILDQPCGQRLKPMLPEMVRVLKRCRELIVPESLASGLVKMGSATIDRRLEPFRKNIWRRIHGTTKPGSLLRKQIPIELSRWNEKVPGFAELDLVSHCGMSAKGQFISTLNLTDLATGWTESEAVMGHAQRHVLEALQTIRQRLPFTLKGIDPDNGSEFINWSLYHYCLARKIQFTRGRPGKKNDNPYIEEKNWTHIRKVVGYDRLSTTDELELLNSLYSGPLRLYLNFFQPVMKLIKKTRVRGQLKKKYDIPQTPYQRVLKASGIPSVRKQELANLYETLNPVKLKAEIERHLKLLSILGKEQRALIQRKELVRVTFPVIQPVSA